jgi:two-component system response regulator HydG
MLASQSCTPTECIFSSISQVPLSQSGRGLIHLSTFGDHGLAIQITSSSIAKEGGTKSPQMEKLYHILSKVTFSTHPVLILGESGTRKDQVARSIHISGPSKDKPFLPIDCGSRMPSLLERELFGYVEGSFTGEDHAKAGMLSVAEGGTIFFDEVGDLPLDLQAKLVRALQEKEVRPVGGTHPRPITVRVLAATNRDLPAMVERGEFRKDLFFRLNVVHLRIPALRDRRGDIPLLAIHFLARITSETGVPQTLSDEALRVMQEYDWPGNVRELESAIERASALSSESVLDVNDLPIQLQSLTMRSAEEDPQASKLEPTIAHSTQKTSEGAIVPIAEVEKQLILKAIRQVNGDKILAAKLLGIGKTTLYRKLKEYQDASETATEVYDAETPS